MHPRRQSFTGKLHSTLCNIWDLVLPDCQIASHFNLRAFIPLFHSIHSIWIIHDQQFDDVMLNIFIPLGKLSSFQSTLVKSCFFVDKTKLFLMMAAMTGLGRDFFLQAVSSCSVACFNKICIFKAYMKSFYFLGIRYQWICTNAKLCEFTNIWGDYCTIVKLHCFRYQCTARSKTFNYQIGQTPDHLKKCIVRLTPGPNIKVWHPKYIFTIFGPKIYVMYIYK